MIRRVMLWGMVLTMLLLPQAVWAADSFEADEPPAPFAQWPQRRPDGFLPQGAEEFVFADPEAGRFIYLSDSLQVHIERHSGRYNRKKVIWYMADIRFEEPNSFRAYSADPARPSRTQDRPERMAAKNKVIYAQNGDLFSFRLYNKDRVGLIIRDGKVLHEDTYTRPVAKIPPLDELALYADGHIEMNTPGVKSAQQYIEQGARDVLAFGPILFKDRIKDDRLDQSFTHREPRSALGVVGPGHFVGIMVEGRNDRSAGAPLRFVADRLLDAGCVEAFTLDGGQTAAMVFMGKNVMDPGIYSGYQKVRKQQDIIGIGISELVAAP